MLGSTRRRTLQFLGWSACLAASLITGTSLADTSAPAASFVTPDEFTGTDVERINKAIEAAAGRRVVIPPVNAKGKDKAVWLLDSAILVRDGTVLEFDNCRVKLSDRCRDNMIRSVNCGLGITDVKPIKNVHIRGLGRVVLEGADRPRATGDGNKTLGRHSYGTDAGVAAESQTSDWRNHGILLAFVDGFAIQNLTIRDSHCWAISLERCSHGTVRDIDFASTGSKTIDGTPQTIVNQDGLDLRMGCHDILVENISGHAGDDLVALTAIPFADHAAGALATHMATDAKNRGGGQDDIRDVIIRNVRGYSRGGHHIVRLLNAPGVGMHAILVDGLVDTAPDDVVCRAAVKIGDADWGGGNAVAGETSRIVVRNVMSRSKHAILVGGSLTDSSLENVLQEAGRGDVLTVQSRPDQIRDVTTENVRAVAR
jgi:polygalacturonase